MNAVAKEGFAPYEMASATLLAQQPVTDTAMIDTPEADWNIIFTHLEARYGMLRVWRYSWWTYWSQLAEYILPRRYRWLITPNLMNKGNPINQSIIDSTGTLAMQVCAAGMVDGLMPSSRPWFKLALGIPGAEPDVDQKRWLEDSEQRAYEVLAGSNFYNTVAQCAQDEVVFGTAPTIVYEDSEDVIRLYNPCSGEYYLAASARLSIDTLYREFTFTVAEIVEMFTIANCPSQVVTLWNAGGASLENEFVVIHAIEPNFALNGRGGKEIMPVKGGFPYREFYWLKGVKTPRPLSRRGFHEKPFAVARWSTVSNDAYGRSPGMDALPDIKQLQLETARKLEAIEKQVRPPMVADVMMKNEPSSILPGHITYTNTAMGGPRPGFWPAFEVEPDLKGMVEDLKQVQGRIKEAFLVDVFMAITNMEGVQPRNDLEIQQRLLEKLQRLGPVINLWKTEFAGPIIERVLRIMERRKLLLPMPPSMKNVPLKIEYMDMVTLAQLGAQTASMEQTFRIAGELSEAAMAAQEPSPLRVINMEKSLRIYAGKVKYPEAGLYSDRELQANDAAKAKAKEQEQVAAAALPAVQAAKTLSETQLGGGKTALGAMLGAPSGV